MFVPWADENSPVFLDTMRCFGVTREDLDRCLVSFINTVPDITVPDIITAILREMVQLVRGSPLQWDDVLKYRDQIVGSDIEFSTVASPDTLRGPIEAFVINRDNALFVLSWFAQFDMQRGCWVLQSKKNEKVRLFIAKASTVVEDIGGGLIRLVLPGYEHMVILIGQPNLNPKDVRGL